MLSEAPQAQKAKGPTPEDLRQALLQARKDLQPKPQAPDAPEPESTVRPVEINKGQAIVQSQASVPAAVTSTEVAAEVGDRRAEEQATPRRSEEADADPSSAKMREPEAALGKEEKEEKDSQRRDRVAEASQHAAAHLEEKDRDREHERRERDYERDRERRREREAEKEREYRRQRDRELEEREERRRRDRGRETERSDRQPSDRDRDNRDSERDRERARGRSRERSRSREAADRSHRRHDHRSHDRRATRSASKRLQSRSPSLSPTARTKEERERRKRNSMRSPIRLSSLRSRSKSPRASRPRSSTRTERPRDPASRPSTEPSRLGKMSSGRAADGAQSKDAETTRRLPTSLALAPRDLPPPRLAPLPAPAHGWGPTQQHWPPALPQGYVGFGGLGQTQLPAPLFTSASGTKSRANTPPPPPPGDPAGSAALAAAIPWSGKPLVTSASASGGAKIDPQLAKTLAASHLAASLSGGRGSGGLGESAQGHTSEPGTPDASYLAVKASALKHLEKNLGSGEFRQQSAERQGPSSEDLTPGSTAAALAPVQPAQQAILLPPSAAVSKTDGTTQPAAVAPRKSDEPQQLANRTSAASAAPQAPQRKLSQFGVPSLQASNASWLQNASPEMPGSIFGQPVSPQAQEQQPRLRWRHLGVCSCSRFSPQHPLPVP